MVRAWLSMSLLVGSGCHVVFGVEPAPAADANESGPVQQVVGARDTDGWQPPFTLAVAPTGTDRTLVVIAAVRGGLHHIETITDSGQNVWTRVLDGEGATGTMAPSVHVELWHAAGVTSASTITIAMTEERAIAVSFTEWPGIADPAGAEIVDDLGVDTTAIATGAVATRSAALVIGAAAWDRHATSTLTAAETIAMEPFRNAATSADVTVAGAAAYRFAPPGTYEMTWSLDEASVWSAGVVGLQLR